MASASSSTVASGTRPSACLVTAGRLVVVETKSHGRPTVVDRWLWAAGHRPDRLSKYAVGLALLTPGLPANRWQRTLARLTDGAAAGVVVGPGRVDAGGTVRR